MGKRIIIERETDVDHNESMEPNMVMAMIIGFGVVFGLLLIMYVIFSIVT